MPAAAVHAGRSEVKGRAWHPSPTTSHLTRTPSVWWTFVFEEKRRHTRTVTTTDAKGNSSTHQVVETQFPDRDKRGIPVSRVDRRCCRPLRNRAWSGRAESHGAGRFERSVPPIRFDFPSDDQV